MLAKNRAPLINEEEEIGKDKKVVERYTQEALAGRTEQVYQQLVAS
jgi:hypothetical protein